MMLFQNGLNVTEESVQQFPQYQQLLGVFECLGERRTNKGLRRRQESGMRVSPSSWKLHVSEGSMRADSVERICRQQSVCAAMIATVALEELLRWKKLGWKPKLMDEGDQIRSM